MGKANFDQFSGKNSKFFDFFGTLNSEFLAKMGSKNQIHYYASFS